MTEAIRFDVLGEAAPQGSKRVVRGHLIEASKKLGPWRQRVAQIATHAMDAEPMTGPVWVTLIFEFRRPESHFLKSGALRRGAPLYPRYPDLDKAVRAMLDALTGIVFVDDEQVVGESAEKMYGEFSRVRVEVRPRKL